MDQISNMLVSIKNAGLVKKDDLTIPHSKLKESILTLLKKEGYIKTFETIDIGNNKKQIRIVLEYIGKHPNIYPRINEVKRVSKLSKRVYSGYRDIKRYKFGKGLVVLSTPKGILSGDEARKELCGGEFLFKIW